MENKQLKLFKEITHLDRDYFISGLEGYPDPDDEDWETWRNWNYLETIGESVVRMAEIIPFPIREEPANLVA